MITITPEASEQVRGVLSDKEKEGHALRLYVRGMSCSGPAYGMALDNEPRTDDTVIDLNGMGPARFTQPALPRPPSPLGQGIATAVGMALAERLAADRFGPELVDHYTYVVAGDGCLMEGISQEAISLAGHYKLGKLIVFFDDNSICIDGPTDLSESDDQPMRFKASGWHVISCDGHNPAEIEKCIKEAQAVTDKPMKYQYVDQNRIGDHIWYISDCSKFISHYPGWYWSFDLRKTLQEIHDNMRQRVSQ